MEMMMPCVSQLIIDFSMSFGSLFQAILFCSFEIVLFLLFILSMSACTCTTAVCGGQRSGLSSWSHSTSSQFFVSFLSKPWVLVFLSLGILSVYLCTCYLLCARWVLGIWGGRKRTRDPLELETQAVVSQLTGSGNQTPILCKNKHS